VRSRLRCVPQPRDATQLLLWTGLFCGGFFALRSLSNLTSNPVPELMNVLYFIWSGLYIIKLIGFYDDRMMSKRAEAKQMRHELDLTYDAMLNEMSSLMDKAAESNALFAEQNFESKQRDFLRFLERVKKFSQFGQGTKSERHLLLMQLRRFVKYWLMVFQETSVDPVNAPRIVVLDHEIDECSDIRVLCELVTTRLAAVEAKVVLHRRQRHNAMIKDVQDTVDKVRREREADPEAGVAYGGSMRTAFMETETPKCCSWIRTGNHHVTPGTDGSGYPRGYFLGCVTLVTLSREHVKLLLCVAAAPILLLVNMETQKDGSTGKLEGIAQAAVGAIGCYVLCLFVLLVNFERIDSLMQLTAEVVALQRQREKIAEMHSEMSTFWTTVQDQVDVWLHRTMPRLELVKEIHQMVEDGKPDEVAQMLESTYSRLERLEDEIGDISSWKEGGSGEGKRMVGETIRNACRGATSVRQMLGNMDRCLAAALPHALEQPGSPAPMGVSPGRQ